MHALRKAIEDANILGVQVESRKSLWLPLYCHPDRSQNNQLFDGKLYCFNPYHRWTKCPDACGLRTSDIEIGFLRFSGYISCSQAT